MTDELSPEKIAQLLKDNERHHTLTPGQRSRLWARIDAGSESDLDGEEIRHIPTPPGSQGWRRPLLVLAAGLLIVIGVYALDPSRQPQEVSTFSPTEPEIGCPPEVDELLAAVELWESIENWSHLTDERAPDPDLLLLAEDALATDGGDQTLLAEVATLVDEREAGTLSFSSHDRRALRALVENAVADLTARHPCD